MPTIGKMFIQLLEEYPANHWNNISPTIGKIFRQTSEKLYKIIFMVYNIVIEDGNEVF